MPAGARRPIFSRSILSPSFLCSLSSSVAFACCSGLNVRHHFLRGGIEVIARPGLIAGTQVSLDRLLGRTRFFVGVCLLRVTTISWASESMALYANGVFFSFSLFSASLS